jgi:hypothetical protein
MCVIDEATLSRIPADGRCLGRETRSPLVRMFLADGMRPHLHGATLICDLTLTPACAT